MGAHDQPRQQQPRWPRWVRVLRAVTVRVLFSLAVLAGSWLIAAIFVYGIWKVATGQ